MAAALDLVWRVADRRDVACSVLDGLAIAQQHGFLDSGRPDRRQPRDHEGWTRSSSKTGPTFPLVESGGVLAGSGGWSRRATLRTVGDHSPGREPALLNPEMDAARVRAMYTAPAFANRRGVGRR